MTRHAAQLLIALLVLITGASSAQAGSFNVTTCGPAAVNEAWTIAPTMTPPATQASASCTSSVPFNGLWVRDVLASPTDLADGQGVALRFDAVAGTRITGIVYRRWLWKVSTDDLRPELRTGDGTVLETCSIPFGEDRCDVGGAGASWVAFTGLDTTRLEAGVRCEITEPWATTCPGGGTAHAYGAIVYDARVTIADDVAPAKPTVDASGLWSEAAWQHGTTSVVVSAADATGISAVRVYADGSLLVEQPAPCTWTRAAPCAAAEDVAVPIDTTVLDDGQHVFEVAAIDAAGNESPRAQRTVTTTNAPPPAPAVTLSPTSATSPTFDVTWTATHAIPIARAHVRVCLGATCSSTSTTMTTVRISAVGVGENVVQVYLEDVIGRSAPQNVGSATFVLISPPMNPRDPPPGDAPPAEPPPGGLEPPPHPDPDQPPSELPPPRGSGDGGKPPALRRTDPRLRANARTGARRVRVSVTLSRVATSRVHLVVRMDGRRAGRRWTTRITRTVRTREGRSELRLHKPGGLERVRLSARYGGDARLLAGTARSVLHVR